MAAGTGQKTDGKAWTGARGTVFFGIVLTLMFLALAARLVHLQIYEHPRLVEDMKKKLFSTFVDLDKRGDIVDSKGVTLAASVQVQSLAIDPYLTLTTPESDYRELVGKLQSILGFDDKKAKILEEYFTTTRVNAETGEIEPVRIDRKTGEARVNRFVMVKRMLAEKEMNDITGAIAAAKKESTEARTHREAWEGVLQNARKRQDTALAELAQKAADGWRTEERKARARFAGVYFTPEYKRVYPQGELAAHIVGFTERGGRGAEGMEKTCESFLVGTRVNRMLIRDARTRGLSIMAEDDRSTSGMTVELTIDSVVQAIVEEELKAAIDHYKKTDANVHGHAIVVDPFTGDILAMANYPTFDPNRPGVDPATGKPIDPRNRDNNAVAALQEPGSTFKPVIVAASLEEKTARLEEPLDCSTFYMGKRAIKDIHPYGRLTVQLALIKSSNPGMVRLGQRLGPEKLREWVLKFGFGVRTGSGLAAERHGNITSKENWNTGTMGSVPMGYEIDVTTLQMAMAYSTFANGGLLPKPNIVRAVYDQYNGLARETKPEMRRRVISSETAATMRQLLRKVVTDGTGRRANYPEYELGGKTGTANMTATPEEKARTGKAYSNKRHTANFVALAPWDKPRAVVCVSIRDTTLFGGEASSPVVKAITRRSLAYWGVPTADGSPIRADFQPQRDFKPPPVPIIYTQGGLDDENRQSEEIDYRWIEEWVEDETAVG